MSAATVTVPVPSEEVPPSAEADASPRKPTASDLQAVLMDESAPVAKRNQCIFFLKNIGGTAAVDALAPGLSLPSVLLAHEVAYVLGQMGDTYAVPFLSECLANKALDPVVRHESAEALAAIGKESSMALLESYCDDEAPEVADTCKIAVDRLKWCAANPDLAANEEGSNPYESVDPAPGHSPETKGRSTAELQKVLNDSSLSLFDRYKAMFALRNQNDDAAVAALATGFTDKSAVFRHEIAYIMGQLQHPAAVECLQKALADPNEHSMVRHEAAEALGAIAVDTDMLESYKNDKDPIIKESCEVALSIADYWSGFNEGSVGNGNDNEFVGDKK